MRAFESTSSWPRKRSSAIRGMLGAWDDEEERQRLEEVKEIADTCEDDWPAFRAEVAKLRPFWSGGEPS
jgi:hypothetical protein